MAKHSAAPKQKMIPVDAKELVAIVERTKETVLSDEDRTKLKAAVDTVVFLQEELKKKGASITRLQQILFGSTTEKTKRVLKQEGKKREESEAKEKPPGHGRRKAAAYTGAERMRVGHPTLRSGENCPECLRGKVYNLSEPSTLVRITGMAPLSATVWECERLRCNLCGEVFTADAPQEVGDKKYDESATSMVALLKYGCGLPFNRIQKLQEGLGIPLPATTQWELVREGAAFAKPAYEELIREAAQGEVLHNDDTTAKILDLSAEQREAAATDGQERRGVYTSGIISTRGKRAVALFFTGPKHAGENLREVLRKRAVELPPPIQMCDALPSNRNDEFETILANCNSHGRRRFVEQADYFPEECRYVLETFRELYRNDALTRNLTPEERLLFHHVHSAPLMEAFEKWLHQQLDEHKIEPNSGLGAAIRYMLKHWSELTLFLRVAGAPLDNNICERALKRAILQRKNSLFFKTQNGARVSDIFMSLIHSAELSGENPFDYLVTILRHPLEVRSNPSSWMPWNYRQTVAEIGNTGPPP